MVVALICPCFNVTIHLEHAPAKLDGMTWLSEYYEISKGVGKASLAVAGVTIELPQLTQYKTMNKEWTTWKCLSCINCETFIYTSRNNDTSQVYVNNCLIPRIKKDDQILQQTGNQSYSPVWKIVLNDEDNCSNRVLETPDDSQRLETFKQIENQMTQYLRIEEEKMKQRIKEYEELQHEGFRELQSRVYRDRKVLWHTIMKKVQIENKKKEELMPSLPISSSRSTETSPLTTPSNTPVVESVNAALITSGSLLNAVTLLENVPIKLEEKKNSSSVTPQNNATLNNNAPAPSHNTNDNIIVKNAKSDQNVTTDENKLNRSVDRKEPERKSTWVKVSKDRKKDSSDSFMFKFEENEDDSESDDDLHDMQDDDDEEEETDNSRFERVQSRYEKPPKIMLASSVPVAIPQPFANFRKGDPSDFEPSKPKQSSKKPSEADLSKSFAVPVSRTKITGWI